MRAHLAPLVPKSNPSAVFPLAIGANAASKGRSHGSSSSSGADAATDDGCMCRRIPDAADASQDSLVRLSRVNGTHDNRQLALR
eukprot:6106616-Pleurochrysis_carterae.AAC.4